MASNYGPVAILPVVSKVPEIVATQLMEHLVSSQLFTAILDLGLNIPQN